jgi:competence protein ComEC
MDAGADEGQGERPIAGSATPRGRTEIGARDLAGALPRAGGSFGAPQPWYVRFPPIYAISLAILGGDGLGNFHVFLPLWLAALAGLGALALFLARKPSAGMATALAAVALASTASVHRMLTPASGPLSLRRFHAGTLLTITGRLAREPEWFPDKTRIYVSVSEAGTPNRAALPVRGLMRVTVLGHQRFRIGDEVRFAGRIRFPRNFGDPGEFDYESFMARQGIAATALALSAANGELPVTILGHHPSFPASQIEEIRHRIGAFIGAHLDEPVASEMKALVIGERGGIGQGLRNTFARTGMAHLLVISGLHLSMVAAAVFGLIRLLMLASPAIAERGWANKIAAIGAMLAVSGYAAIAGHHISTERALIMVLAYMFAVVMDRPRAALASLALAAIVICLVLPGSSADIGFQLSFASVVAIVLGMRRFTAWAERRRRRLPAAFRRRSFAGAIALASAGYVAVSFWATLGTAPLVAYDFNQFSTVGLVANAVVVPIMGLAGTVTGLAASAMSLVAPRIATPLLTVAGKLITVGNYLAGWFVGWPLAWMRVFTPTILEIALAYGALMLWLTWPMPSPDEPRGHPGGAAADAGTANGGWRAMALAVIGAILVVDAGWWTYQRYFNPRLRVAFLSVGQGDAAVVQFPGRRVMVVDAGGAWHGFDMGQRVVARYLWSRKIMHVDWLALSHPDLDHFGGFAFVARNFSPRAFWTIPASRPDVSYLDLLDELRGLNVPIRFIDDSVPPIRIGAATLQVLNGPAAARTSRNDRSMVLRITDGPQAYLFTGDIEAPAERALIRGGHDLRATVLKVPHHGSRTSSTMDFIEAVHPSVAVISLGYHNRFHFPAKSVLARYAREDARILRTDRDGAVLTEASSDGLELDAYRSGIVIRLGAPGVSSSEPRAMDPSAVASPARADKH